MSLGAIEREAGYVTATRISKLESEISGLKGIITRLFKNNTVLSVTGLIAVQGTAPMLSDSSPIYWIRDNTNPWRHYAKQKDSSGVYQWVQFSKGTP